MAANKLMKKLTFSAILVIVLCVCLALTTFALVYSAVSVENNLFGTGYVLINLNNGLPVITESEFLFEPGMTVEKSFFLENIGTCDVYYKIYLEGIQGDLANYIKIRLTTDSGAEIYYGDMNEFVRNKVSAFNDVLSCEESNNRRDFIISFVFSEDIGNAAKNAGASFDIKAEAVQTKNNESRNFD